VVGFDAPPQPAIPPAKTPMSRSTGTTLERVVAAKGKPEHDIEMFPLKPVPGLTCSEYCAV